MSKRAVILAGGKGTRLKPYTVVLPKPLMPIGDYPILEVIIRQLVFHGFNHITLALNYQADIFKAFFGDGSKWGIKIDYSIETDNLGTIAPLCLISDLPDNFLVMNGDILSDINYADFFEAHVTEGSLFTISSFIREHVNLYGVLDVNEFDQLVGFTEKPKTIFNVSMGIYMVTKEVLKFVPEGKPYGFDNLMLQLIELKKNVKVKKFDGYWLDIGRPDDYMKAIDEFEEKKNLFLNDYQQ